MATLPPSPFTTLPVQSAETLVVAPCPQAPVAAISGPFDSAAIVERPAEASAVAFPSPQASDAAAECSNDLSCIGEIFVGAAKLEPVEMWFENTAYPREDELLYEVLEAMDNPHERDLPEIPAELWAELDEPPLFLRQAV